MVEKVLTKRDSPSRDNGGGVPISCSSSCSSLDTATMMFTSVQELEASGRDLSPLISNQNHDDYLCGSGEDFPLEAWLEGHM